LSQRIDCQSQDPGLLRTGHNQDQRPGDLCPGLGRLYYGVACILRRERAVFTGSYCGVVPPALNKTLGDNLCRQTRGKNFLNTLKQDPGVQLFDVPFGNGVTLRRKITEASPER
jgi:hypothetical protein